MSATMLKSFWSHVKTQTWKSAFVQNTMTVDRCKLINSLPSYKKEDVCRVTRRPIDLFHQLICTRHFANVAFYLERTKVSSTFRLSSQNKFFTLIWKFQLYCPNDKTISVKYNYKRWNTTFVFQRRKNFYYLVLAEIFMSFKKTVIATWLALFLSLSFSLLSVTKTGLVCNPKIRNDLVLS